MLVFRVDLKQWFSKKRYLEAGSISVPDRSLPQFPNSILPPAPQLFGSSRALFGVPERNCRCGAVSDVPKTPLPSDLGPRRPLPGPATPEIRNADAAPLLKLTWTP
jgi:hypothetical protein